MSAKLKWLVTFADESQITVETEHTGPIERVRRAAVKAAVEKAGRDWRSVIDWEMDTE